MNSFDVALRDLVDEWRAKGTPHDDIIAALRDEIESLQDVAAADDLGR